MNRWSVLQTSFDNARKEWERGKISDTEFVQKAGWLGLRAAADLVNRAKIVGRRDGPHSAAS